MTILAACIAFNVSISILFKLFDRWKIDIQQAIVTNYIFCFITAGFVKGGMPINDDIIHEKWLPYAMLLGALFIVVFNITALTVRYSGVMAASIFQRMSLIAPAFVAMVFFNEPSHFQKWLGIVLAIIAIILISISPSQDQMRHNPVKKSWLFPALTFIGASVVDTSLYLAEHYKIASGTDIRFLTTLFLSAGITGFLWMLYLYLAGKKQWAWKNAGAGAMLGVLNLFSIYFLIYALHHGWDGSVLFPVNNMGVLLLAALTGVLIFKEDLTHRKVIGFVLATGAIILLAFS
jgi:drug/metabolite transporter (DMT)-like permease